MSANGIPFVYKSRVEDTVIVRNIIWVVLMTGISLSDIRKQRIPDIFVAGIFCLGITGRCSGGGSIMEGMGGMAAAAGVFFLILLTAPGSFGGGDVKLSMANGYFLGAGTWLTGFAAAVFLAGGFLICLMIGKRKRLEGAFPFGPFLCLGAVLAKWGGF